MATDDKEYLVATGPLTFDGAARVIAERYKPGVYRVTVIENNQLRTIYCRDEYLPASCPIG